MNPTDIHEWAAASSMGTQFSIATFRGQITKCKLYSFVATSGSLIYYGDGTVPSVTTGFTLNAFELLQTPSFNIALKRLAIVSADPILVTCDNIFSDFLQVFPISSESLYSWHSQRITGIQADLSSSSLLSTIAAENPVCRSSDGLPVTITPEAEIFEVEVVDRKQAYKGSAVECQANDTVSGMSLYVIGDGLGGDGTTFLDKSRFASFFVLSSQSKQFAILSDTGATCTFKNSMGGVLATETLTGIAGLVKGFVDSEFSSETVIECTAPVMIVAQFNEEEYNLLGLQDEAIWKGVTDSIATCSPTSRYVNGIG